jgi:hypothetical protein
VTVESNHAERIARLSDCKQRSSAMSHHVSLFASLLNTSEFYSVATGLDGQSKIIPHIHHKKYLTLAKTIRSCSTYLVFEQSLENKNDIALTKIHSCKKHLLCPVCSRLRAAKAGLLFLDKVDILRQKNPQLKLAFVTLTVKNGDDLLERFNHLQKSFRSLMDRRRDFLKRGTGFTQAANFDGGVFSYEIKRGKNSNQWHPHIHMVVALNDFVKYQALADEWKNITKDSCNIDIRLVYGDDIQDASLEVFKYALKFSDMSLDDNFDAYLILSGKRLYGSFGCFWGLKLPDDLLDEPLLDERKRELIYFYDKSYKYYFLKND